MINEPISLAELAKVLRLNKSKLAYWKLNGLLEPKETVSGMQVYEKDETIAKAKSILKMQKSGMRVEEIRNALKENAT